MNSNTLPGCLYQRGRRWWYKLHGVARPCVADGSRMATTSRQAAEVIARRMSEQDAPADSMAAIVARFAASDGLSCTARQTGDKRRMVLEFVESAGIRRPIDITPATITTFMARLSAGDGGRRGGRGESRKTITNKRASIGRFCAWLLEQGELSSNPVKQTRPPKLERREPVHLTHAELEQALKVARRLRLWPVFFAAYTGARLGELSRLTWGDIRQGPAGLIVVLRETKANRPRSVPVTAKLAVVIRSMRREAGRVPADGGLFPERSEEQWQRLLDPIRRAVPKVARKGGGWHDFRRTVGSLLVQGGAPIYTVAKILGHSNVTTTAKYYAHLDAESGRDVLEGL